MTFLKNEHNYPIRYWVKMSAGFSLCLVSVLIMDSLQSNQGGFWLSTVIVFFGLFMVIVGNLFLHIYLDVTDPIKSPFWVKILAYLITFGICIVMLLLSHKLGILSPEESNIITSSPLNFVLLGGFRAAVLNVIVLLWLYFVLSDHVKNALELDRSNLDKLKERAENQMLRQQVQPHFIFNALSSLKALIKKDSDAAESYLLQLSDYLRESFSRSEDGLASVEQELKLCENYLEMQRVRFKEAIQYEVFIPEEALTGNLPVFSLQPLVDNAIKHNLYSLENPLIIHIHEKDGWIVVKNNYCPRKSASDETNNYGLNNLQERFSYYLKDSVLIHQVDNCFQVHLKILGSCE